jgi:hypothetical protein
VHFEQEALALFRVDILLGELSKQMISGPGEGEESDDYEVPREGIRA